MLRGYKYRIYPNESQATLIARTIGCSRFVYNHMLSESLLAHENGASFVGRNAFNYRLTALKKEFPFLAEVDATALTAANDDLADAFARFFKKQNRFPHFRKKKNFGSYTSKCVGKNIRLEKGCIRIPKLGSVKAVIHRVPEGSSSIKSVTVSQGSDGTYYASVLIETINPAVKSASVYSENAVGLDYKSDGLYADSEGNTQGCHKFYRESEVRLAKQQRRLSRKSGARKGETPSNNYRKQQRKVAKLHRHIANQRLDHLHKLSTEIANRYDIVCVESLNMRSMANKGFGNGKATLDNGYGLFLDLLEYKLSERGKHLVKVDKWYPSSQICSRCGQQRKMPLSVRTYRCSCGLVMNRDTNAAINIKNEGLRVLREGTA